MRIGLIVQIKEILDSGWAVKNDRLYGIYSISINDQDFSFINRTYEVEKNEFIVDSSDLRWDPVTKSILYKYMSTNQNLKDWK